MSPSEPIRLRVEEISKVYAGPARLRLPLLGRGRERGREELRALDRVSFQVRSGEALGVVGRNGSGKSTLLKVLAGALPASSGHFEIHGRVGSLLDLTSGINPDFSGAENSVLLGMLAGHTRAEALRRLPAIRDFSGLGDAFERPVKGYSAGMTLRLGFSAAVHAEPEVLLIDEALAVGDAFFQQRCLKRMREFRSQGRTIVLVSHDTAAILSLCDRAIWLEGGRIEAEGAPEEVVRRYHAARYSDDCALDAPLVATGAAASEDAELSEGEPVAPDRERFGDGAARIEGVSLRDAGGAPLATVRAGEPVQLAITARTEARIESALMGFTLRNRLGDVTTATNSEHEGVAIGPLEAGERLTLAFDFVWPPLASGPFSISPAIADGAIDGHRMCDWVENALLVQCINPRSPFGWMSLEQVETRVRRVRDEEPLPPSSPATEPEPPRRLLGALERPWSDRIEAAELGSERALYVSGWAFASDGSDVHVHVRLGDEPERTAPCRNFRDDVAAVHSASPWSGRSGFGLRLPVPAKPELELVVEACSDGERLELAERTLQLPDSVSALPRPRARRKPSRLRPDPQRPHVLWISHRLNLEGAPRSLFEVAAGLGDRYRMSLLSPAEGPLRGEWEARGIPTRVQPLEIQGSVDDYEDTIRRLAALRSADPPELVVANTLDAFWGIDLARELDVPSAWIIREGEAPETYFFERWPTAMAERASRCFETASRLVFVAHATRRAFGDAACATASSVVWNGIDHEEIDRWLTHSRVELRSRLGLPEGRPILLCVGTPCQRKGQRILLRALTHLRESQPTVLCVFLGVREGEALDLLRAAIADDHLSEHVLLQQETREPLPWYPAADVCVCPSFQESLPRSVMEAAAFGRPIVASDIDGVPELVRNGREALLVPPGDERALARAVAHMLDAPEEAQRMGRSARARSRSEFSLAASIAGYDRLLRELLEDSGEPA